MEVLILTTFVSVLLAASGVGLFVWTARARTFDHADRLALLPLRDDAGVVELNSGDGTGVHRR